VREGHAGNGLHFHFSPRVDGEHMGGMDEHGSLAPSAQWLIGGLVQFGGALMAFGNREHTSFLRLTQGKEAPTSVTWGRYDRQALVRLPIVAKGPDGRPVTPPTIEFRLADGSAHPHLLLAGIAQAMAQGQRTEGLADILRETASGRGAAAQGMADAAGAAEAAGAAQTSRDEARSVAHRPAQVAAALRNHRDVFEAAGVFPPALLDTVLAQFEGR
jgi:glutamine synthetase